MNTIYGTAANDVLTGTSGSDYLDGGIGADTMTGKAGDDVYIVDNPGDIVIEAPGEGIDRVNSTVTHTLAANVENLWLVGSQNVSGYGNGLDNVLWGNSGNNTLDGGAGNDIIDGGAGADTMIGGTGDDTFWVDNVGDVVIENSGEGTDTVKTTLSYTLGSHVENLILLPGAGDINGTGNELNNTLTGNEGNNILDGGAGNDTIDGGAGADTMIGGTGDDTFYVDNVGDVVVEKAGEGTDTVISTLDNYTLPDNVENLTLGAYYATTENLNGTGNGLDNIIRGNSGNNVLDGGAGNDTLIGGDGNDTLTGGPGNDVFYISTTDTGVDTITDLSSGDTIRVCGAFFSSGSVSDGDGKSVQNGEVQLSHSGNQTILSIGTDSTPGADVTIKLDGSYVASNFQLSGFDIRYDTNHAPTLDQPISDQQGTEGNVFAFQIPANTFSDADGDAITYSAVVLDPDWGYISLPSWLTFDSTTRTFSGTPTHGDIGSLTIAIIATDSNGASTSGSLLVTVDASQTTVVSVPSTGGSNNNTHIVTSGTKTTVVTTDNVISGSNGNDTLTSTSANDRFDGGVGLDTAQYASTFSNFTITKTSTGYSVKDNTGALGTDTLTNIERLQFADKTIALDVNGTAGEVYRLYQAAFNRTPDSGGLGDWIYGMDNGMSLQDVSGGFTNSPEFKGLYGQNPTTSELVNRLYNNVLHRTPEQAGFDYWANQINSGLQTITQVLTGFSESPENQVQVVGSIQNGIEYTPHHVQ